MYCINGNMSLLKRLKTFSKKIHCLKCKNCFVKHATPSANTCGNKHAHAAHKWQVGEGIRLFPHFTYQRRSRIQQPGHQPRFADTLGEKTIGSIKCCFNTAKKNKNSHDKGVKQKTLATKNLGMGSQLSIQCTVASCEQLVWRCRHRRRPVQGARHHLACVWPRLNGSVGWFQP